MEKTSRRSFGKLMTGALAALPVVSATTNTNAKARAEREESPIVMYDNRYHENTPPPVEIAEGSFSVLIKTKTTTKPLVETGTGPFLYQGKVEGHSDNNFETIKILHGSGE